MRKIDVYLNKLLNEAKKFNVGDFVTGQLGSKYNPVVIYAMIVGGDNKNGYDVLAIDTDAERVVSDNTSNWIFDFDKIKEKKIPNHLLSKIHSFKE